MASDLPPGDSNGDATREPGQDDDPLTAADIEWIVAAPPRTTISLKGAMLRCCCCRELYRRGHFRCCAPPNGMSAGKWLELACPMPSTGGCGKCWRHCQCADKRKRMPPGPMAAGLEAIAAKLGRR